MLIHNMELYKMHNARNPLNLFLSQINLQTSMCTCTKAWPNVDGSNFTCFGVMIENQSTPSKPMQDQGECTNPKLNPKLALCWKLNP